MPLIAVIRQAGSDPLRTGLVTSLSRPGGNITGVSTLLADTEAKRLELLRELRPHATTTAALVNPGAIPRAEIQLNDIQTAARSVGQEINILNASTIRDIDVAFAKLVQMRADALSLMSKTYLKSEHSVGADQSHQRAGARHNAHSVGARRARRAPPETLF